MPTNKTEIKIKLTNNDELSLEDFFNSYYAQFHSFANNYISDKNECEDIVQEVFISFWEQKKNFPNLISIKAYFYTSIRHKCLNYVKHDIVKQKYLQASQSKIKSTEFFLESILRKESNGIIYNAINKLPTMEKKVLLLALEDYSNEQIAEELNIKINTVKTHKSRAYHVLRKKLGAVVLLLLSSDQSIFNKSKN